MHKIYNVIRGWLRDLLGIAELERKLEQVEKRPLKMPRQATPSLYSNRISQLEARIQVLEKEIQGKKPKSFSLV